MNIEVTFKFAKQSKRMVRFEPIDDTIAVGAVYIAKLQFGINPELMVADQVFPALLTATFTVRTV